MTLLIPVFNEAANLPTLIAGLGDLQRSLGPAYRCRVLFVDDGSTDDTSTVIKRHAADPFTEVLSQQRNLGPGRAFLRGFLHLVDAGLADDDLVVTLEGDNTSHLALLHQMLRRRGEGYEVVLASPYTYGGGFSNTPVHRVLLSHCGNGFVKAALGIRGLLTLSSFYRLYEGRVLHRLIDYYGREFIETRGFESMVEVVAKLVRTETRISEVPLRLDTSHRRGKSKMRIPKTICGYLKLAWRSRRW